MQRIKGPLLLVGILVGLLGGACGAVNDQPSVIPTPSRLANPSSSLDLQYQIAPIPLSPNNITNINLTLKDQNLSTCYGIPGKADIFTILQPAQGQDRLWQEEKKILGRFLGQASQDQDIHFGTIDKEPADLLVGNPDELLPRMDTISPDGPDLSKGIQTAVDSWKPQDHLGAKPAILLFVSHKINPSAELDSALSLARQAGFSIHAVAYQSATEIAQQPSLSDFAGSLQPDEFTINPDAASLRRALVRVTSGSSDLAAQDIKLTVLWSPVDLFKPAFKQAQDLTALNGNVLWTPAVLSVDGKLEASIQGQINPGANLATASFNAVLSYIDCNGFRQEQTAHLNLSNAIASIVPTLVVKTNPPSPVSGGGNLPENTLPGSTSPIPGLPLPIGEFTIAAILHGIQAFVLPLLPSLGWILPGLLALLLLYMIAKALMKFFRKPEPKISPIPKMPPHLTLNDSLPAWLKALKAEAIAENTSTFSDGSELQETILIGLGAAGREILSAVSLTLTGRYGNSWRSKVRLAYIDVIFSKTGNLTIPYGLDESQCVFLQPDFIEIKKSINDSPQEWKHWDWYDPISTRPGRADGRMALFYDLKDGITQSKFYNSVEKAALGVSNPAVRVLGTTFDDVSSGMLVDVARLTQIILQKDADVQLWLMGPTGKDWSDRQSVKLSVDEQGTRTLATLRELERFQRNSSYNYAYVGPNNLNDKLRQTYNYAVVQTMFVFDPLNTASTKEEALDVMVDSLLSTLSPSVNTELGKHLSGYRARISNVVQHQEKGVMCGIGTFSVKTTNVLIEDAMAWRMVRDLLFGEEFGLYPRERTDRHTGDYETISSYAEPALAPEVRDEIFENLYSLDFHKEWDLFIALVTAKLNEILNGGANERTLDIRARRKSIDTASKWLNRLAEESKNFPYWELQRRLVRLQSQLAELKNLFDGDLYDSSKGALTEARQRLMRLRNQKRRTSDIPEELEWSEYKRYIRQSAAESRSPEEDLLPKMGKRFGWRVAYDESGKQWVLNFVVPPRNFEWYPGADVTEHSIPFNSSKILDALHLVALTYSRIGQSISAAELAKSHASSAWIDNAEPMLNYNSAAVSRIAGGLNTLNILAAPRYSSSKITDDLHQRLVDVSNQKIELCETKDDSTITILRVVDWIPFEATAIYAAERWLRRSPDSSQYVWKSEQIVSAIEGDECFSAQFAGLLGEDEQILSSLGLCLLYKLVEHTEDGWALPGLAEPVAGDTWGRMLVNFFVQQVRSVAFRSQRQGLLETWKDKINQQRKKRSEQKYAYFKKFTQDYIDPQNASELAIERDLARYLGSLIEQEKQARTGV